MEGIQPNRERRRCRRYNMACAATLYGDQQGEAARARTDNISNTGCLITTAANEHVKCDQELRVNVMIPRQTRNTFMLELRAMKARVVRLETCPDSEMTLALQFGAIQELELE